MLKQQFCQVGQNDILLASSQNSRREDKCLNRIYYQLLPGDQRMVLKVKIKQNKK